MYVSVNVIFRLTGLVVSVKFAAETTRTKLTDNVTHSCTDASIRLRGCIGDWRVGPERNV